MRLRSALLLVPSLLVLALFAACNGQGEGQACSYLNGNADCQNGLDCKPVQGSIGYRCCPGNPQLSTTAICGVQQNGDDADTPPSTLDASETEAGDGQATTSMDATTATDSSSADASDAAPAVDATSE